MTRLTKYQKEAIVRSVMDDVPKQSEENNYKIIQQKAVELMSDEVRAIYEKNPNALAEIYMGVMIFPRKIVIGDADLDAIQTVYDRFLVIANERTSLKSKIYGAIRSCNTLKQLQERLPEFEKYYKHLETAPASKNLPAIANVVAELTKFGWPKDAQQKAEAAAEAVA